ncbi:MAG: hypothetical protein MUE44_29830 [Oscillatoriaceae cyanobacterium Prado104]|jgi:hypothetical protein|nr:hypothetical protein [Oscillatoriaceae cyanobacterium Prado104]
MLHKHETNNSLLSVLDFASGRSLVVELGEKNEELLLGGHTGEDRICPRLTAGDVQQVTGTVSHYGIRSIPTLMF